MVAQESVDKESRIKELKSDIDWIKNNVSTPGNPVYKLYASNSPKKDLILGWAKSLEELHKLGDYKEPITNISTTIRNELKDKKLGTAIKWAYEVLPFKYKNPTKIHSEDDDIREVDPPENSSISSADKKYRLQQMNKSYLRRLEKTIELLKKVKHNLETETEFVPKLDQSELGEYYVHWDAACTRLEEVLDGREKILPSQQHILFYCLATSTQSFTFSEYIRHIRDLSSITPKQAGKILRGHVTKIQLLFEPKNRKEACEVGFYGTRCDQCGSYRVEYKYNSDAQTESFQLFCHACKTWSKVKTEKLMVKIANVQSD